ncbi:Pyrroline-5-carboxylate reductase 3 [Aphelenchoides besseyi]|nr:Pyrroline-5-carboxylate reductase 3 [Aphelenchoides besseyi]KAI6232034.1 Pyrroline-5-carboxylate reductase 3 [Aphelenchoides besseyi]
MRIGFIGAGKMAQALARGLIQSGRYDPTKIIASCPKTDVKLLEEIKALGVNTTHDNVEVAHESDAVFVAVKPVHVSKVTSEIAPVVRRDHLLISIALGITLRYIETLLPAKTRVVRVMPNTPAVVSAGASAYSMGAACQDGDSKLVEDLLKTVGYAVEVPELYIDPITGLSGSGPSYIFAMIEGLADGGVKQGLPRDLAIKLSAMTFFGAAKMVLETGEHPAILKEAVQSPGGSTVYGIHEMEKGAFRGILISAVEEATKRSRTTGEHLLPRQSSDENEEDENDDQQQSTSSSTKRKRDPK